MCGSCSREEFGSIHAVVVELRRGAVLVRRVLPGFLDVVGGGGSCRRIDLDEALCRVPCLLLLLPRDVLNALTDLTHLRFVWRGATYRLRGPWCVVCVDILVFFFFFVFVAPVIVWTIVNEYKVVFLV